MTDGLAAWWVHDVTVERYAGQDAFDEAKYAAAVTVTGFYRDGETVETVESGEQIVSSGRFAYPADVATIPLQSKLTLPAVFGGQKVHVVKSNLADGPVGTPAHKSVGVN